MKPAFEKLFGFDSKVNNVRTEILAGITTFLTMAYILAVNPSIFSALPGMPAGAVFTATALAAIVGTLIMALYAKKPFALAPGMGLNAFFVFTVCLGMGYSWQFALTAVLLEGILFIILTVTKIRSWLLNSIPGTLKKSIGAGIGLFIAFIGMQNAGIIVHNDSTLVSLGEITKGTALLAMVGLLITSGLVMAKIRGGILWGILITTALGLVIKDPATGEAITKLGGFVALPHSVEPIFCKFEWHNVLSFDMLVVVFISPRSAALRYHIADVSGSWCSPSCSSICLTPWAPSSACTRVPALSPKTVPATTFPISTRCFWPIP